MRHAEVTLEDKFLLERGRVFITGVQALVRVLIDRRRLDGREGLKTAGFLSGYRGSPLGGLDQQAHRAGTLLTANDIVFKEGLNEDLAATAVWGSQQANLFPGARYDGVFGMWYGKAPGVDRTGDAFKHANFAGTWPKGGVVAVAGDDHACKSSTLPSQSEYAFQDFEMPVLAPADVQEVLDYGLMAYALSRFSGLWVGLIALADTMDSLAPTIDISLDRHDHPAARGFRHAAGRARHPRQGPAARQGAAAAPLQAAGRARLCPRQPDRPHDGRRPPPPARHRRPRPGLPGRDGGAGRDGDRRAPGRRPRPRDLQGRHAVAARAHRPARLRPRPRDR